MFQLFNQGIISDSSTIECGKLVFFFGEIGQCRNNLTDLPAARIFHSFTKGIIEHPFRQTSESLFPSAVKMSSDLLLMPIYPNKTVYWI